MLVHWWSSCLGQTGGLDRLNWTNDQYCDKLDNILTTTHHHPPPPSSIWEYWRLSSAPWVELCVAGQSYNWVFSIPSHWLHSNSTVLKLINHTTTTTTITTTAFSWIYFALQSRFYISLSQWQIPIRRLTQNFLLFILKAFVHFIVLCWYCCWLR